jgi:sugar (pentulose or hexulose) kinase
VEESAQATIQVQESLAPQPDQVAIYERYYQVYRGLYPAVKEFSHTLARLGAGEA